MESLQRVQLKALHMAPEAERRGGIVADPHW
jgi:hypothetical protein